MNIKLDIKSFLLKMVFILMLSPTLTLAADMEKPTIYVIKQGDTLWGLSERFIKDPNYWPQMWAKNRQITNPHFIYPGQKVRVFPDRLEFVPKEQSAQTGSQKAGGSKASEQMQLVAAEKLYNVQGNEGFLLESNIIQDGTIISINHNREIAGIDDIIYTDLGTENGIKGGEKYSIFRKAAEVKHPVTNKILGTKIISLGSLQITDVEAKTSRAIITANYREISKGSYLLPQRQDQKHEVALKESASTLDGYIVDSFHGTSMIAVGDVVYIDLGTTQGAEPGNMLYIVRDVKLDEKFYERAKAHLPQELIGALVILESGINTSTAIIVKSVDTIYKGDKIVSTTH